MQWRGYEYLETINETFQIFRHFDKARVVKKLLKKRFEISIVSKRYLVLSSD